MVKKAAVLFLENGNSGLSSILTGRTDGPFSPGPSGSRTSSTRLTFDDTILARRVALSRPRRVIRSSAGGRMPTNGRSSPKPGYKKKEYLEVPSPSSRGPGCNWGENYSYGLVVTKLGLQAWFDPTRVRSRSYGPLAWAPDRKSL